MPSLSRIDHIPEPIDVAVVAVPTLMFEKTVGELLDHGTDIIIGITSEIDIDVQKRVVEKCEVRVSNMRRLIQQFIKIEKK